MATSSQTEDAAAVDAITGLRFYDLSHPWGHNAPLWHCFPDVKIERFHYHAKSGVLSQQITTFMHCTTHTDAPAHVIEGTPAPGRLTYEVPTNLPRPRDQSAIRETDRCLEGRRLLTTALNRHEARQ